MRSGGRSDVTDVTLTLYQALRSRGASSFAESVADLGLTPDEIADSRAELVALGLIVPTGTAHDSQLALDDGRSPEEETDAVAVIAPEIALLRLLEREQRRLRERLTEADEAYERLEHLAARFLRAGTLDQAQVEVEVLTDYRRIQQVLEDIADVIQHDLASLHPGALRREIPERALDRDRRQLESGVRVRAVYNRRFASVPEQAEYFRRKVELGVEVRLSPVVPMDMVLADQQFALLPVDPEDTSAGAILARGSALVRSYLALFEYCWHTATSYGEQSTPEQGGDGLTEQQRAALRMLASGMKDEKIARSLGVSLRTVSRVLSELMQELGASSRFEAGVRATRLGWLD
ncbi:transcriptional regulator [Streptomyces oceani]|uniref:Transcriptional regulator n=1 Tax=Streptomyces oceani TaxID=1075402 RepID=A0A1E7KNZ6_9ACTN|nr:transcriptional regulator [Streptomyces oceani]